jgi:DNA-directed RNA polymerase subunit RPC12/RpoP
MSTKRKITAKKAKKVYVCVPCGTEVTVTKSGMGVNRLMCCGEVMKPKTASARKRS